MPLLEVKNLTVGIRQSQKPEPLIAVDTVNFDLQAAEIKGLAGESGCGKSLTALSIPRLHSGGIEICGGDIFFEGKSLRTLSEKELQNIRGKDISMIFQEPLSSLNPLMKIGAQIEETLKLHGVNDKKMRKAETLEMLKKLDFDVPDKLIDAYPHQLSGGMAQRVMIAIAAICRPKLLIADEPTTALDTRIQNQILDLLVHINHEFGTAILFISHDLDAIRRICSRVLVMYAGKIVEEGKVTDIFSAPAHPYTRRLIEAIPRAQQKGKPLANIRGAVPSIKEKNSGCPFAGRCDEAEEKCRASFPEKRDLGNGHTVYCVQAAPYAG